MPRKPCRHGDHGVGAQFVAAEDLAGAGCCHFSAALFAIGLPRAVALGFLAHPGGWHQVDLGAVHVGH